jgi:hypothetical protein
VTVNGKVPGDLGVPEISPVLVSKARPVGRVPDVNAMVNGDSPPPKDSGSEKKALYVPANPVVGVDTDKGPDTTTKADAVAVSDVAFKVFVTVTTY